MANLEDLLQKQKSRIEKINTSSEITRTRKKITRTGPTRPWQENLPQYQDAGSRAETERDLKPDLNTFNAGQKVERKYGESEEKVERKISFSELIGLERKVTFFIFDQCQLAGSRVTTPISINHLCEYCQAIVSSAKRTILTLQKKEIILRIEYKDGRGGWTRYSLANHIFSEILQTETSEKLRRNQRESREKVESQLESKVERAFSSSSSILINENLKTTTTSPNEKTQLSDEWKVVNFTSLVDQGVTFSEIHLVQLSQRTKHTPKMVQDAIEFFAFDLKHNDKRASIKGDPVSFFMGIMQRGMYTAPSNFVDPAEAELDRYLEQQESKLARIKEKLAKKADLDFELWLLETTEEQRRQIAPQAKQDMGEMQKGILKNYWKTQVPGAIEQSGGSS